MPSRAHALRRFTSALFLLAAMPLASPAQAGPPDDDLVAVSPLDFEDIEPTEPWETGPSGSLWLAVSATSKQETSGDRSFGALLLLGLPLERLGAAGRPSRSARYADPPKDPRSRAPRKVTQAEAPPPLPPLPAEPAAPVEALPIPTPITLPIAREAVRAALRRARLLSTDADIDALASRARTAALLPELRLRATRLVDEAENLAPTEYDPSRTTASGGTSLWLEARATWRLDRVVFADDEIAIERLRHERAAWHRKVVQRVLDLLFAWQRATALEADASRTPEQHRVDTLAVLACEAALDVETDGWFGRFRGAP